MEAKELKDMSVVEILDKSIDQEQLGKDLFVKYVGGELKGKIAEIKAKVASGEIDLIKGTDIEKPIVIGIIDGLERALGL